MAGAAGPLIYCQDLVKIYPLSGVEIPALRGVSLHIGAGEMVAIMGASGSGKSTLLNILGCMDEQTGGRYLLDGVEVSTLPEQERAALRNRKLGFVFQRYNLLARASALENVQLPLYYAGESGPAVRQKALEALQIVGLAEFAHHRPNQLSGGQQQRVAIARAVVGKPLVILADEPTGALDTQNSAEVMEIFQQLNRRQGVTVIIVTHEPEVAAYCRRKIIMRDGLIVSDE